MINTYGTDVDKYNAPSSSTVHGYCVQKENDDSEAYHEETPQGAQKVSANSVFMHTKCLPWIGPTLTSMKILWSISVLSLLIYIAVVARRGFMFTPFESRNYQNTSEESRGILGNWNDGPQHNSYRPHHSRYNNTSHLSRFPTPLPFLFSVPPKFFADHASMVLHLNDIETLIVKVAAAHKVSEENFKNQSVSILFHSGEKLNATIDKAELIDTRNHVMAVWKFHRQWHDFRAESHPIQSQRDTTANQRDHDNWEEIYASNSLHFHNVHKELLKTNKEYRDAMYAKSDNTGSQYYTQKPQVEIPKEVIDQLSTLEKEQLLHYPLYLHADSNKYYTTPQNAFQLPAYLITPIESENVSDADTVLSGQPVPNPHENATLDILPHSVDTIVKENVAVAPTVRDPNVKYSEAVVDEPLLDLSLYAADDEESEKKKELNRRLETSLQHAVDDVRDIKDYVLSKGLLN